MDRNIELEKLESYSIELENHLMKWLFELEEGVPPSEEHKDQIIPLSVEASNFLWEYEGRMGFWKFYPHVEKYFKEVTKYHYGLDKEKELKKWLFKLGIPFKSKVFIAVGADAGFVLTWKMVIIYSSKLFFAREVLVWDKTINWGLFFHHDDIFHFGKNRIYNAEIEGEKVARDAQLIAEWKRKIELNKINKK